MTYPIVEYYNQQRLSPEEIRGQRAFLGRIRDEVIEENLLAMLRRRMRQYWKTNVSA